MHIPDNYLSPGTCAVLGAAAAGMLAVSVRHMRKEAETSRLPLVGIGAAFSFLVMMFNLPLPGGTTGHAVGAVLVAALAGPWSAFVAVAVALLVQAVLFGDGGILALGANVFNMAFVMPFSGIFIFGILKKLLKGNKGELLSLGIASWVGLNMAALFTAVEFGLQPLLAQDAAGAPLYCPYPLAVAVPAMMIPHMLIAGLVEAGFTVLVYGFIQKVAPESLAAAPPTKRQGVLGGILGALIVLSPLGLLAAGTAWGEWAPEEVGIQAGFSFESPFPDYSMAGMPEWLGYTLSAFAGAALLIIAFRLVNLAVHNRKTPA